MKKIYSDVIERMKEVSQTRTDTELATLLDVQKSSISAYKNRGIPKDKLIIFSQKYDVDLNWLETGDGKSGFDDSVRVVNLHEPLASDTIRIEILDVEASAGNGAFLTRTEQGLLAQEFDLDFFRREFGRTDAKNLKIIAVKGDSMSPTLESGDLLYVDVAENHFSADGLYVFTFDDHTFIKRLQKRGREMWAMSDNKAQYEPWQIPQDEPLFIHGRVVFSLPMKMKKW